MRKKKAKVTIPPASSADVTNNTPVSTAPTPATVTNTDTTEKEILTLIIKGQSQREIAARFNKSDAWVSALVARLKTKLGDYDFELVKQLGKGMREAGVKPHECIPALNVINIMKDLGGGVGEDYYGSGALKEFITNVHQAFVQSSDMPSEKFAGILKEMLCLRASLGNNNNRITSLDQLPDYLRDAIEQKRALDAELESLRVKTEEARSKLEDALRTSETTIRDIEQFIFVRGELKKYLKADVINGGSDSSSNKIHAEVRKLANMLNNARELGYNPSAVVAKASTIESLGKKEKDLGDDVMELQKKSEELVKKVSENSILIDACNRLRSIKFGIGELEALYDALSELARANQITPEDAKDRFFKDVKEQYAQTLGFEITLDKLDQSVKARNDELRQLELAYGSKKQVADALDAILAKGMKEEDILYWQAILQKYHHEGDDAGGVTVQSLASDLEAYGSIKESVNKLSKDKAELSTQIDSLSSEIDALQDTESKLEETIDGIAQKAGESIKHIHKVSLELIQNVTAESTGSLRAICNDVNVAANPVIEDMRNIRNELADQYSKITEIGGFREFEPLIRAARGDQEVDFDSLRSSVMRAIELVIPRLSEFDQMTKDALLRALKVLRSAIPESY
jgi:prefoldin subunit 5